MWLTCDYHVIPAIVARESGWCVAMPKWCVVMTVTWQAASYAPKKALDVYLTLSLCAWWGLGMRLGDISSKKHQRLYAIHSGTVNRCGYSGQKNALFVTLMDHVPQFEAYWSQLFAKFDSLLVLTSGLDDYISKYLSVLKDCLESKKLHFRHIQGLFLST